MRRRSGGARSAPARRARSWGSERCRSRRCGAGSPTTRSWRRCSPTAPTSRLRCTSGAHRPPCSARSSTGPSPSAPSRGVPAGSASRSTTPRTGPAPDTPRSTSSTTSARSITARRRSTVGDSNRVGVGGASCRRDRSTPAGLAVTVVLVVVLMLVLVACRPAALAWTGDQRCRRRGPPTPRRPLGPPRNVGPATGPGLGVPLGPGTGPPGRSPRCSVAPWPARRPRYRWWSRCGCVRRATAMAGRRTVSTTCSQSRRARSTTSPRPIHHAGSPSVPGPGLLGRGQRGRPRMRSAMMVRRISVVPPMIV